MSPDEFVIPHFEIKMVKNRYFAVILHQPQFRYVLWEENLILYSVNLLQTLLRTIGPDQFLLQASIYSLRQKDLLQAFCQTVLVVSPPNYRTLWR